MTISILGTNGMLSSYLSDYFCRINDKNIINLYGIEKPYNNYSHYEYLNLLNKSIDFQFLSGSDLIIYAAGAGVQAGLNTDPQLMYELNLKVPIDLCNALKKINYKGFYISFGSYMEIGINNDEEIFFKEEQIEFSHLPVTNDYALSKRLLTRFMGSLAGPYIFWHFILPNIFLRNEKGTRLIPYVLNYLNKIKKGEICESPKFSSGEQIRQYINFEDVCYSITKCIEYCIPSGIYNIGGGEILSIKDLIDRLFKNYNIPISNEMFGIETRRDGNIKSLKLNGDKLYNAIQFLPHQQIESIL